MFRIYIYEIAQFISGKQISVNLHNHEIVDKMLITETDSRYSINFLS